MTSLGGSMKKVNGPFFVIGLHSNQVADGILTQIGDVIRNKFFETGELVKSRQLSNAQEVWSAIYFADDMLSESDTQNKYLEMGYDTILYFNDVAWKLTKESIPNLTSLETINDLPTDNLGTYISMPHWK